MKLNSNYLKIRKESVTGRSKKVKKEVNVGWVVGEIVEEYLNQKLGLLPVNIFNSLNLLMSHLKNHTFYFSFIHVTTNTPEH